jgi:hypothetical protein
MRHRFYTFEQRPFHLSHRIWFWREEEQKKLWDRSVEMLRNLGSRRIISTQAFVLMSNHFHHLWAPCESPPQEAFSELSKAVAETFNCKPPLWGDSNFSIDSFYQFQQVYKYIYRNPVEAGLVRHVEDYSFSTIQSVLGMQKNIAGLLDPFGLIFDQSRKLVWLNTPSSQNEMSEGTVNRC